MLDADKMENIIGRLLHLFPVLALIMMQNNVGGASSSVVVHPIDRAKEGPYPCGAIPERPSAHVVGGQESGWQFNRFFDRLNHGLRHH